ncbi:MAG: sugar ABC transporter permease, partial [Actinomycetota bacterium]
MTIDSGKIDKSSLNLNESVVPHGRRFEHAVTLIVLVLMAVLILPPIGMLLFSTLKVSAFKLPFTVPGFSLANFTRILGSAETLKLLGNTAVYAIVSVTVALMISTGLAFLLERTNVPARKTLSTLVLSPMAIPPVVLAIAWVFLANPTNGIFTEWLRTITGLTMNIYSLPGLVLVSSTITIPS